MNRRSNSQKDSVEQNAIVEEMKNVKKGIAELIEAMNRLISLMIIREDKKNWTEPEGEDLKEEAQDIIESKNDMAQIVKIEPRKIMAGVWKGKGDECTFTRWMVSYERAVKEYCEPLGIKAIQRAKAYLIRSKLSDEAASFYLRLSEKEPATCKDFEKVKKKFEKHYVHWFSKDYVVKEMKRSAKMADETYCDYMQRLTMISDKCESDVKEDLVYTFADNAEPGLKAHLRLYIGKRPSEAKLDSLVEYLMICKGHDGKKIRKINRYQPTRPLMTRSTNWSPKAATMNNRSYANRVKLMECYGCGKRGHIRMNCSEKKNVRVHKMEHPST